MEIDFHHAATYVAARIAGFSHENADIIAYSAQYVDDATSSGAICFDNKAMYSRISSAHKSLDLDNMNNAENHVVWLPFHFLPGNGRLGVGRDPTGDFINKIVCGPDSPIAQEMVAAAIRDQGKPYSLHRLGITMHVYADTWAHQGFAGVLNEINEVEHAEETSDSGQFAGGLPSFLNGILDDAVPPLGHGRAYILPDMPFLSWQYLNGKNQTIRHDNTKNFCDAANALCIAMKRYIQENPAASVSGIGPDDMEVIRNLFSNQTTKDGKKRHKAWLAAIEAGKFSFGKATPSYAEDGKQSWKAQALGTSTDMPVYTYRDTFLNSNWKLFHDALQLHRLTVLHDILPEYGICAA